MTYRAFLMLLFATGLTACDQPAKESTPLDPARQQVLLSRGLDLNQVGSGQQVYEQYCATCHGQEGKGQPGDWRAKRANGMYPPPPLDDTAHAWHHATPVLRRAIEEGSPPGVGDMPPWKGKLTDRQIDDVIVYIKSLWSDEVYRHWLEIERQSQG
jgi:mono/diheme cytochrome c family protein